VELSLGGPFAWSTPGDAVRWTALVTGLVMLVVRPVPSPRAARVIERAAPFVAAALSVGYIAFYLRGGPRIIDATAYLLEARAFASGKLSLPLGEPEQAVLGRFLVRSASETPSASVIFPPGWPAVLAAFAWVGAPLAAGPVIAAGLCLATAWLTRLAIRSLGLADDTLEDNAAATAAVLSVFSAALRYHTADTMSHGLSALCVTVTLAAGWEALTRGARHHAALAGLGLGLLFATRPVSALALATTLVIMTIMARQPQAAVTTRARLVFPLVLGAALPLALWFAYQVEATGSLLATAQGRYYTRSDGPPGCFRYGFGAGIGCVGEHGDFVAHRLRDGFGVAAALGTTGRRLLHHVSDPLSFGPLFGLVVAGACVRAPLGRVAAAGMVVHIVAYAPFYFDGSYPGGGARLFADVLPLEHVLATLALVTRTRSTHHELEAQPWPHAFARGRNTLSLMFLGFAFGTGAEHDHLRRREGGRPMYDARIAASAGVDTTRDLVFLDTDHGFNLAYRPGARVARRHDDALDRLSWEAWGRPRAFNYRYDFASGSASLVLRAFDSGPLGSANLRIEGESLWPPLAQEGGYAWLSFEHSSCTSRGRALALHGGGEAKVRLSLPRSLGGRDLTPSVAASGEVRGALTLFANAREVHTWRFTTRDGCERLPPVALPRDLPDPSLVATGSGWALDALEVSEIR
jgi:hypothetical protein